MLAVRNGEVVGVAELKFHEMEIYPEKEHWLGGVYVSPSERGKRVAARLIERTVELARTFGVRTLHLQTERPDGGLYRRLGWEPLERTTYKGIDVTVMARELAVAS